MNCRQGIVVIVAVLAAITIMLVAFSRPDVSSDTVSHSTQVQSLNSDRIAQACNHNYITGSDCFEYYNVGGVLCIVYPAIDAFQCEEEGLTQLSRTLIPGS